MTAANRCAVCGRSFSANLLDGLCPACVASQLLAPPPDSTPERRLGDYELLAEIGRGGMGIVYRARQISLDRIVAVKTLPAGTLASAAALERFRTEARTAARLQHPHIVAIHEVRCEEGECYFSMDYVPGRNLAEVVRLGPLPPEQAVRYLRQLANAVAYAHSQGVLHRDLKPSNVLLDEQDQPRITDFGLAKRMDAATELTQTGQLLGSPAYLPPEQLDPRLGTVGVGSDVYGLGAILHHLLTGQAPFTAPTVAELLHRVLHREPECPPSNVVQVPPALASIVRKCLRKRVADRYASATELAEDLRGWEEGRPVLAHASAPMTRLLGHARRRPALALLIMLLVSSLGGLALRAALQAARLGRLERSSPLIYVSCGSSVHRFDPAHDAWTPLPLKATGIDVSPDHRWLSYIRAEAVYRSRLDGSAEHLVADGVCIARWLDNRTLLVQMTDLRELRRIDVRSGAQQPAFTWDSITTNGVAGSLELSPDRSRLLCNPQNGFWTPTQDLYVIPPDGRQRQVAWEDPANDIEDKQAFWLGHDRIVWCRNAKPGIGVGDHAVVSLLLGETNLHALTDWVGIKYPIGTSPNGSHIVFVRTTPTHEELWIMGRDGANPVRWTARTFPRGGMGTVAMRWVGPRSP